MTYFIAQGSAFRITNEANIDIRKELPVGTYSIMKDMAGFYLETVPDIVVEHKIYGSATKRADRIINTFQNRKSNTGVVLQGEKGSGKTMLARLLSMKLRDEGVSTLVVNTPFSGEAFNTFISQIEQPIMVFFDEFEKVYDRDSQSRLLTLFDGTYNSQKLFVATLNDFYLINDFMKNRPGRFFYSFKYEGLEEAEIREYCLDNLKDHSKINSIVTFASSFDKFNFDILKAIVEEMNRYNESIGEVVQYLNARPNEQTLRLEVKAIEAKGFKEGMKIGALPLFNPFTQPIHIFASDQKSVKKATLKVVDDDDDDYDIDAEEDNVLWFEISFKPSDIVQMTNGQFVYKNDSGTAILARPEQKQDALQKFYEGL